MPNRIQISGPPGAVTPYCPREDARRCLLECRPDLFEDRCEFRGRTLMLGALSLLAGVVFLGVLVLSHLHGLQAKKADRPREAVAITQRI